MTNYSLNLTDRFTGKLTTNTFQDKLEAKNAYLTALLNFSSYIKIDFVEINPLNNLTTVTN